MYLLGFISHQSMGKWRELNETITSWYGTVSNASKHSCSVGQTHTNLSDLYKYRNILMFSYAYMNGYMYIARWIKTHIKRTLYNNFFFLLLFFFIETLQ